MLEMPSSQLLDDEYDIEYIGEGAANVVFKLIGVDTDPGDRFYNTQLLTHYPLIAAQDAPFVHMRHLPASTPTSPRRISVHGFPRRDSLPAYRTRPPDRELPLVRLRKNLSTVSSILDAHLNYQQKILPHLSHEYLIESDLAELPPGLVIRCNALLRKLEADSIRPKSRRHVYLADQPLANLVQDMSPRDQNDTVMEFKPKWLAQSPSAPAASKRCRTCALRAMRRNASDHAGPDAFCPLDLTTESRHTLQNILFRNLRMAWKPARSDHETKAMSKAAAKYLMESQIFAKVKQLQQSMDPNGILEGRVDDDFQMAMTLRDCTLFLRLDNNLNVEARLGDIDLKPESKKVHWRVTEERLRDEKWYTCGEDGGSGRDDICALSR